MAKKTWKTSMKKLSAAKKTVASKLRTRHAAIQANRAFAKVMAVADGSSVNRKANGTKFRMIPNTVLKAWASAAAKKLSAEVYKEAVELRCDVLPEDARSPYLPSVTKGAAAVFDGYLEAYCKDVFQVAKTMKDDLKKHKKINGRAAQAACIVVNDRIARASSMAPTSSPDLTLLEPEHLKRAKYREKLRNNKSTTTLAKTKA